MKMIKNDNTMKKITVLLATFFASTALFSQTADSTKKKSLIELSPSIGVGLVRHTFAPTIHVNLFYTHKDSWRVGLNSSSYFFFEPTLKADNTKDYKMYVNTFINGEFLVHGLFDNTNAAPQDWNGMGIGYLIGKSGDYFTSSTAKVYYISKFKHITIMPEIIFTNDFKTIFPGVTIRL